MASRYSAETIAYAAAKGIAVDELPLIIDGCSGGLSWLYGIAGRTLACEGCCDRHDIDYQLGGNAAERKSADMRLRDCVVASTLHSGWLARLWGKARAWVMYGVVRAVGARYWV